MVNMLKLPCLPIFYRFYRKFIAYFTGNIASDGPEARLFAFIERCHLERSDPNLMSGLP